MEVQTYDHTHELADLLVSELQRLHRENKLTALEDKLKEISAALPKGYSITVNFSVEVFDENRDKSIRTTNAGITCMEGDRPYLSAHDEISPAKYIVDGVMMKVPHDHCPNCWSRWSFKSRVRECRECGYRMGREIKLLLDTNVCPHCENSKISHSSPRCEGCGYVIDQNIVTWG
ncbi:MAG TPA: hypothetical protein VK465_18025 [Fibrobacteria bacterium]|nr:hypothetical protein [Fibrobacteria bacterium]